LITKLSAPYSGQNNALEGEKIELKCSASKYDYSGMNNSPSLSKFVEMNQTFHLSAFELKYLVA
jgi:hypothetical protein